MLSKDRKDIFGLMGQGFANCLTSLPLYRSFPANSIFVGYWLDGHRLFKKHSRRHKDRVSLSLAFLYENKSSRWRWKDNGIISALDDYWPMSPHLVMFLLSLRVDFVIHSFGPWLLFVYCWGKLRLSEIPWGPGGAAGVNTTSKKVK